MIIDIVKPYISSGQRMITLDNITITLQENEVKELYESLDNELHYGNTKEDLQNTIVEIEDELDDIVKQLESCNFTNELGHPLENNISFKALKEMFK